MKIFHRNKEASDPAIVIPSCLKFLLNRITDDLEREEYNWDKPWGVKRFESIVLAKFIMDYSFEGVFSNILSEDERSSYYNLSNSSFSDIFNEEFSEIGMNYEDMQEVINKKINKYFIARKENHHPHECYYEIFTHLTGEKNRKELEEELRKKECGLELMHTNKDFESMIPQYKSKIKYLEEKIAAFDLAEIMIPHMIRATRQKLRILNTRKIKSLSKKLSKESSSNG